VTVLVATFEGIAADRRVASSEHSFRPGIKIVRGDGIVAGFCGGNTECAKAMAAVRAGETDPQALAEICDGLVVTAAGRYDLSAKLATRAPKREAFLVNGSGWAEAQAFLRGRGRWRPADLRDAVRYTNSVRLDCGDGCDWLALRAR
jgi:hypothetical protein